MPESDRVISKLEEMDNKLERIKSDTQNLNRIASLSNRQLIIIELKKIVGRSEIKAAVVHLTKELISATDLSNRLGIDPSNLSKFINPFLENRGYISVINRGNKRLYQRSELIDLVGFENDPEFLSLVKSWEIQRTTGQSVSTADAESK